MNNTQRITIIIIYLILVFPFTIYAYFDPGTGSLVVQFLVAMFATFVIFYKNIKIKVKQMLGMKIEEEEEEDIDINID